MHKNLSILFICSIIVLAHSLPQYQPQYQPIQPQTPSAAGLLQTTYDGLSAVISSVSNLASSTLDSYQPPRVF